MKNKIFIKISIILPFLILLGCWFQMEYQLKKNTKYIVSITGYDPRDLLSGHYVQYQIKWNFDKEKLEAFEYELRMRPKKNDSYYIPAYLCMTKKDGILVYSPMLSKSSNLCLEIIRGQVNNSGFRSGQEFEFKISNPRFYIPENDGAALEKLLIKDNAQISFVINSNNDILVEDLLINGKPWKDAVKK